MTKDEPMTKTATVTKTTTVPTKLYLKGTASVKSSVKKDLEQVDPTEEVARATIEKYEKEEEGAGHTEGADGSSSH